MAALILVSAALIGAVAYFSFRTWREERVVKRFITLLTEKNYQGAYRLWGCTPDVPCRYYAPEKFTEDWGPEGTYNKPESMQITDVDVCGSGVVIGVAYPGAENFGLWVASDTRIISFAPWPRCPGRHLAIREFLRSFFDRNPSK